MFARFNGTMTESESSNTYIAGYEHSFFPSRPGLCVLGMLEASQVPWVDVRTCMGSWTPRSLSALTNTDGLVLPSTTGTVSALRKSAISSLISPAHALRYRRFAHPLAGTDARLAAKVARYTFLSAGLAPAVHARVSLAHPRKPPNRGSSPHGRGTRRCQCEAPRLCRFIPARAGNTPRSAPTVALPPVHPRTGGEHTHSVPAPIRTAGSSPHGRGTRQLSEPGPVASRFIPARAGNTLVVAR